MPASILSQIVAKKREELAAAQAATPLSALQERIAAHPPALDFAAALRSDGISLIAEVKKASPSKGLLRADFQPTELAATYADNGAAAISVITDGHFLGDPAHLTAVKESGASANAPVLRKDFLFDPYQVHEARAIGADTYLLIVDILSPSQLSELIDLGKSLGMTPLVETHDADEIATAVAAGAQVIGINNRDLHTFVTDLATTERLAALIPPRQGDRQRKRHQHTCRPGPPGTPRRQRRPGRRGSRYRRRYGGESTLTHGRAGSGSKVSRCVGHQGKNLRRAPTGRRPDCRRCRRRLRGHRLRARTPPTR